MMSWDMPLAVAGFNIGHTHIYRNRNHSSWICRTRHVLKIAGAFVATGGLQVLRTGSSAPACTVLLGKLVIGRCDRKHAKRRSTRLERGESGAGGFVAHTPLQGSLENVGSGMQRAPVRGWDPAGRKCQAQRWALWVYPSF